MNLLYRLFFLCSLASAVGLGFLPLNSHNAHAAPASCPTPALSRFQRHTVARGETLESIAQRYNLLPSTLIDMNPSVRNGNVTVGSELQIPPYNGIVVEIPSGQTWRQVAETYKVRADTLFEINGCQQNPRIVFVPRVNNSQNRPVVQSPTPADVEPISIAGYPLQEQAPVGLPYGWQIHPTTGEVFFHSGVDLLAPLGSPVQAIAPGTIVFADDQGSYGNLVIVNHGGGLQSRYAHLENINVAVGQTVDAGDLLGNVGTTGQPTATQPHLHFEMRSSSDLGWVAKDPKEYFRQ
ncbi:MAG: M23 family metallopeptidase [Nostoc sp. LLA-1]|nr:M23 family metallopeptidase [Cyanocohniella sp. LLY]